MLGRALIHGDVGYMKGQAPGQNVMSQLQYEANTTAGASTLTVSSLLAGVINRSGPGAGYNDTLPTVDQLIAACPTLSVGDSFSFMHRNTVAFAMTLVAGTGWTLGSNTGNAASKNREYLVTIKSNSRSRTFSASTTNASAVLTNVSETDCKNLQPGQAVTGTNIPASTTIIGVNMDTLQVTMSANATGSGDNIAVTSSPTATIEGVRSADI
jgi:hypothetical protein